jgi:integral membrane protein (TIGR01906 family)
MVDVRHVFDVAKLGIPTGIFIIIVRLQRARLRGSRAMWRLVRDGSVVAFALVAVIGIAAALAFDQMFLLFHAIFFPQGNYLFDPATSDLIRLYPDWYWEGITLRVGVSFLAGAVVLASLAVMRLRATK